MRVLIAERLTRAVFDRYAGLIASADACWAFRVPDWQVARDALNDQRWRTGDYPLLDAADEGLGRWAHNVAERQSRTGEPLTPVGRAMIAYGLQARLGGVARALAMVDRIRADERASSALRIDIIASDPYMRDVCVSGRVRGAPLEIHLRADPNRSALLAILRERALASRWLRSVEFAVAWHRTRRRPARRRKTLGFFVHDQGYLDLFASIQSELTSRGWQIAVFADERLAPSDPQVIGFREAAKVSRAPFGIVPSKRWSVDSDIMRRSPVSAAATLRALDASWVTAMVQLERHRRVLAAWRPDVVASFGPDTMSLALQGAAREVGIPSVFFPHGFLTPSPLNWSLPASATAVLGQGCITASSVNPLGERQEGLVVIGHPSYDEIVRGRAAGRPADISSLDIPPSRPYLVLLFAEWARDLMDHAMQRRTLAMTANALPCDAVLICKLHPGPRELEERARCEDVLGAILDGDAFRIVSSRDFPTPTLLRVCHVAVATEESMTIADAVVAAVPAIGIRHPEQPFGSGSQNHPAKDYHEVCRVVTDVAELREAMIALTRDAAARARLIERRGSYVEKFLFAGDGCSSARAADLVEHLASGNKPGAFVPRSRSDVRSP